MNPIMNFYDTLRKEDVLKLKNFKNAIKMNDLRKDEWGTRVAFYVFLCLDKSLKLKVKGKEVTP